MAQRYEILCRLAYDVGKSSESCQILATAANPCQISQFTGELMKLLQPNEHTLLADIFSSFLSWCGTNRISLELQDAIVQRRKAVAKRETLHRDIVQHLWLRKDDQRLFNFISSIKVIQVEKLKKSYPPLGHWVYESDTIGELWMDHLTNGYQHDKRKKRLPLIKLDETKLVYDVQPDESVIFKNGNRLVLLTIRNFCGDPRVVQWVDEVIKECVGVKRSVRLEDPGKLCIIGYSAGSRSAPKFDWVKNLLSRNLTEEYKTRLDYEASSAFAVFWNMLRNRVPESVIKNTTDFFDSIGIYRMDAGERLSDSKGTYMLEVEGIPIEFHGVELAPPTGVFGVNYSRAIHYEKQPHKYAMAWTTHRSADSSAGGHFFLSAYGIRVQGAANSGTIWEPGEHHGTSLQDVDPFDKFPDFLQTGMSIVTSNRIKAVWEKYYEGGMEEIVKEYSEEIFDDSDLPPWLK